MAQWKKILIGLGLVIVAFIAGGLFLMNQFLGAFALPEIEITTEYISTNRDFINGLTIELIEVDSMAESGTPAKYTVVYKTSCHIDHPKGRPPEPPDRIYFDRKGKYWWTEEKVEMQFIHKGLGRESLGDGSFFWISMGEEKFLTCPMEFQKEQWYFIRISDPKVTGIFFYIDKDGEEHQDLMPSGVSPI